jgi:hypothetical protein
MKPSDLVRQLVLEFPRHTDLFTDRISASVVVSGGVATATAVGHGLSVKDGFSIYDSEFLNVASGVSQDGLFFTFETSVKHDLTFGFERGVDQFVELSGFPQAEWNDEFLLIDVPTGNSFTVKSTNVSPPTTGAGGLIEEGDLNGFFGVSSVPGPDTFVFSAPESSDQTSAVDVLANARFTAVPDFETAERHYTEQGQDKFWGFVIPGPAAVSKDRNVQSDRNVSRTPGDDLRTNFSEPYSVVVFVPTSQDISATDAMDICRFDLLSPVTKVLNGFAFDDGTSESKRFLFMFAGHQLAQYNGQVYIHEYQFEQSFSLTDSDSWVPPTKSFRDFGSDVGVGSQTLESSGELP